MCFVTCWQGNLPLGQILVAVGVEVVVAAVVEVVVVQHTSNKPARPR